MVPRTIRWQQNTKAVCIMSPVCKCGVHLPIGRRACDTCKVENRKERMRQYRIGKGTELKPDRVSVTQEWYTKVMQRVYAKGLSAADIDELLGRNRSSGHFASIGWRLHNYGMVQMEKASFDKIETWMKEQESIIPEREETEF